MKSAGVVCALFLLFVFSAGAQNAGPPEGQAARRLLLVVTKDAGSTLSTNDVQLLSQSILMQVQKATDEVIVVESPGPGDLSAAGLEEAAKAAGADSWLTVDATGSWTALTLAVRSFDLISNATVMDVSVSRAQWQSALDLAQEAWEEIVQPVAGHYHFVTAAPPPAATTMARLTVKAIPGTTIDGLGKTALVADQNGTASRDVPAPHQYTLLSSLRGYSLSSTTIFVAGDRAVQLDQRPLSHWAAELSLQDQANPGFALSWFPVPGILAIRLQVTSYLVGLSLGSADPFSSVPVTDVLLEAGVYGPLEPRLIRVYAMLGVSLRIDSPADSSPTLDPLSLVGLKDIMGAELSLSPRTGLFAEWAPTLYFTAVPTLMEAALGPGNTPTGWVFTSGAAINILEFRVGFRWQL